MKIAVFQNFLDTIGGAEVVGLTLAREFNADLYTTNCDPEKIKKMGFADVLPRIISIGKVPTNAPYRQQAVLWRFRNLNLRGKYDFFIINGDWAVSGAVNNGPNLWYVNATIREIWDLYGYVRKNSMSFFKKPIFDIWVRYNRYLNRKHVSHVDAIVSNSTFTVERVKKYLKRDSHLAYPPVQTKKFGSGTPKIAQMSKAAKMGNYWLSVNRLVSYKRVDMQMRAFAAMPDQKLVVLGPYEKSKTSQTYVDFIKKIKPANVTLLEQADNFDELAGWYAHCKGFITTCLREDFGITAIEAMASGKAVIAPNEGGYRETVKNSETGILINDIDAEKLARAVREIEKIIDTDPEKFVEKSRAQAAQFDVLVFTKKIRGVMNSVMEGQLMKSRPLNRQNPRSDKIT